VEYLQVDSNNVLREEINLYVRTNRQGQVNAGLDVNGSGESKSKIKGESDASINLKQAGDLWCVSALAGI
jgi:hypothetical protein